MPLILIGGRKCEVKERVIGWGRVFAGKDVIEA
jgi:hypothetical protein